MNKFIGIFYSLPYIEDTQKLANYLLYYDEIHFALPSNFNYKNWLLKENINKPLSAIIVGNKDERSDNDLKHLKKLVTFIKNNSLLIDNVVFLQPEILAKTVSDFTDKLLKGEGVETNELLNFINGKNPHINFVAQQIKNTDRFDSHVIPITQATALYYAKHKQYNLILENNDDIEKYWETASLAKNLTKILADQCINLSLPEIKIESPEEILELREKLCTQIIPFRMTMQKLSSDLRKMLNDNYTIDNIKKEAQFLVETKVEPALNELKRKVELEDSSFFKKLFGNVINWIPYFAQIYSAPSPDKYFKLVEKVLGDTTALMKEAESDSLEKEKGLSFLLGIKKFGSKK